MRVLILLGLFLSTAFAQSSSSKVLGNWRAPGGSVIAVVRCGAEVCAHLIAIDKNAPTQSDAENPNPALRSRPLCGLQIGTGFQLRGDARAEDGKLYDPKSGKTYSGSMTARGDKLALRGYIGLRIFGRTETWTRVTGAVKTCSTQRL